jgi:hypothetical protein
VQGTQGLDDPETHPAAAVDRDTGRLVEHQELLVLVEGSEVPAAARSIGRTDADRLSGLAAIAFVSRPATIRSLIRLELAPRLCGRMAGENDRAGRLRCVGDADRVVARSGGPRDPPYIRTPQVAGPWNRIRRLCERASVRAWSYETDERASRCQRRQDDGDEL